MHSTDSSDGDAVGDRVGPFDGAREEDGCSDGKATDGISDGEFETTGVGSAVGTRLGFTDGWDEVVGVLDGDTEGCSVGADDGFGVGGSVPLAPPPQAQQASFAVFPFLSNWSP
mmetsp:Transcript_16346/g.23846  ORF Transcript_16346/g.23846 Transcript_16346/m.23846 type:complete len:114 (+) Transcript_16346:1149-1490(+)